MYSLFDECLTETKDRLRDSLALLCARNTSIIVLGRCMCDMCGRVCCTQHAYNGDLCGDFNLVHHRFDLRYRRETMVVRCKPPKYLRRGASPFSHLTIVAPHLHVRPNLLAYVTNGFKKSLSQT